MTQLDHTTNTLNLRVAEALPKDVGRGLARVDPQDLGRLRAAIGDVVEIAGPRRTLARLMPAYAEQRGRGLVQLDGIARANAGVGLDAQVSLRRVEAQPAQRVVLTPADGARPAPAPGEAAYLARLLDGLPLLAGDQLRATLFGARTQSFAVVETTPGGPVLLGPTTTLSFAGVSAPPTPAADGPPPGATYEDIGGLRREVRRVRELIELPLRHPELFARLGIDPPRGVLLHGPPGCGKTLIARAVAHETSARFVHINGPEIIDQWYGSSERRLRKVFEDAARRTPAIIFIDEIDAIAPKREGLSGERQTEYRVVAQLLTLMDGLEGRGDVVVIAATNIPDALDPALRRPGRFDREIAINVPDREGRQAILEIHTRGMPLAADVDLTRLAAVTHGFVGADLAALGREAAMSALRHLMAAHPGGAAQLRLTYSQLAALHVSAADFDQALNEVAPSAIREVFTEVPLVSWDDVGGLDAVRRQLLEAVEWPLRHAPLFARAGIRPLKGILLHGPPGTGKTLLAQALARASEVNFIAIKGPQLLSKWVGEGERAVRELFRKARQAAPCILFFDELDALAPPRGEAEGLGGERIVSQLLNELDGIEALNGVVVLAATNRPDRVDPALLRPGRFDLQLELSPPDQTGRLAILRVHTRTMPLAADVDLVQLAAATDEQTGADLAGLCRRAALLAMGELIDATPGDTPDPDALRVARRHFEAVLQ